VMEKIESHPERYAPLKMRTGLRGNLRSCKKF
jgi:hypothetical protein